MIDIFSLSPNWKHSRYPSTVRQKFSDSIPTYTEMKMNHITFNIEAFAKFNIEPKKLDTKEYTWYSCIKFKNRKIHLRFQKSG